MTSIDPTAPETSGLLVTHASLPRRIVIVVGSMNLGGAERVVATMANAWAEQGREVWIVPTFLDSRQVAYELHALVRVLFLAECMEKGASGRWRRMFRKARELRRLVRGLRPDVVLSFLTNVNVLSILSLYASGIPVVVAERTNPAADVELPAAIRIARAVLYQYADHLVVQTNQAAEGYRRGIFRPPPTAVIANPLPGELYSRCDRAVHRLTGEVVAMGRLSSEKGFDALILAFQMAFGDDPRWRLSIWGDGPLKSQLEERVHRLGLEERVKLRGSTSRPWEALVLGQIFVLSSSYEGFPNAMLEAMALGVPCIAFDCPFGPRELARGEAAIIVPPGDVESLARALRELANDPGRRQRLGMAAARFVREDFEEHRIMAQWDALFGRVTSGHSKE